jgi:hypothetical protein
LYSKGKYFCKKTIMTSQQKSSKVKNISLWVAQIILSVLMLMGTVMKFMPIEKISAMMPWTGQLPAIVVRLLGLIDLLGAIGLILPALLNIKPQLTVWAAIGIILLMLCAIVFHVSRGEASVIGFNILIVALALFIAWGRKKNRLQQK